MEGAEQPVAVRLAPTGTKRRTGYMKEIALFMDAKEEGREEEKKNTEKERKRAEIAETRADAAEAELARYKAAFGELA